MSLSAILLPASLSGCRDRSVSVPAPPPAEVTVSQAVIRAMTETLEYTGTIAALQRVEIRPRVSGFLQEIHFEPRQRVEAGALLFTIDRRPYQSALNKAKADLDAINAQLVKAVGDLEKVQRLIEKDAASPDELRDAVALRDTLQAQAAQAQATIEQHQLDFDWCEVRAPIAGLVSRHLIEIGNVVAADTSLLANMVNLDEVYVYFNCSEGDALNVRDSRRSKLIDEGQDPTLTPSVYNPLRIGLMSEVGYPHQGVIDYISPELDPATGTIEIRGRFDNKELLLFPGLFVRIQVPIGEPTESLAVTERALAYDQGQPFLLTVDDKNVVQHQSVTLGRLEDGLRAITAGLDPDDWVIVNGLQRVRPGVAVAPVRQPMPETPTANAVAASDASVGDTAAPSPSTQAAND